MSLDYDLEIKEGALFISDAHDNATREGFYRFLCMLEEGELETPQLFLMGDMFDLLIGQITYTHHHYQKTIDLLNRLSQKLEIIYIEGNHDFNLTPLFPHIHVYPLSKQPLVCAFHGATILLSHGDWCEDARYLRYTKIVRNPLLLKLLNLLDTLRSHAISKKILKTQQRKYICFKIPDFRAYIKQKIQKYDIGAGKIDFVCEGHYHQNVEYRFDTFVYKNFSSFACDKSCYRISFTDRVVFEEVLIRG